jgi:predicted nucleotidyltransferase
MGERFGLKESTVHKICEVFARYPQVQQVILYGSRAKGNYKEGSDIDLVLIGNDDLNDRLLARIDMEIDDLLLPYMVDLSILSHITDPDVIDHIRRVGVVFYSRDDNRP